MQRAYLLAAGGQAQIEARQKALEAAIESERAAQAGFDVGTRTAAFWLNSTRERYRAERSLATARVDYLLALLQLKASAGTLSVDDLIRSSQLLRFAEREKTDAGAGS